MSTNADYFELLPSVNSDIRNAVTRDFEAHAELNRKAKGKGETTKEKQAKAGNYRFFKGRYYRSNDNETDKEKDKEKEKEKENDGKKGNRWAKEGWAAWRKRLDSDKNDKTKSPPPDSAKRKEKKK